MMEDGRRRRRASIVAEAPRGVWPQKLILPPNWNCRAVPTIDVIWPAVATGPDELNTVADGRPKFTWFVMLKPSSRSCSRRDPPSPMFLKIAASSAAYPGPMTVLRPRLPIVPAAGSEKQFVSKYRVGPPSTGLGEQPDTRSGHCPAPPERGSARARSKPSTGVNGTPECAVKIPDSCQPATRPCVKPVVVLPNGSSYVAFAVKLWRMSKSDSPLFSSGIAPYGGWKLMLKSPLPTACDPSSMDLPSVYDAWTDAPLLKRRFMPATKPLYQDSPSVRRSRMLANAGLRRVPPTGKNSEPSGFTTGTAWLYSMLRIWRKPRAPM